jgi:hypothetical protein
MKNIRNLLIGLTLVGTLAGLWLVQGALEERVAAQSKSGTQAPRFEVDPFWPKPLPNHWLLGSTIGVSVDAQDHVWIIHRGASTMDPNELGAEGNTPIAECCRAAPPVLEFDQAGTLISSWGGPGNGFEWPQSNHGITVDGKGNVWIGGNAPVDGQVLKFTRDGRFLKQFGFGWANASSTDTWAFRQVAKIFVDDAKNEAYISDGYGNHRVVVIDTESGKFKRFWGAYGNTPNDEVRRYNPNGPPSPQFGNPVHCAELSRDGFLYVCDRVNDRIQVFTPEGKFLKEGFLAKNTLGAGSVWDIAFSRDPQQRFLYVADGQNEKVHIVERQSLQLLTSFGDGGRQPGQFFGTHSIAVDSRGNIYTTETYEGKRVQRFMFKGIGAVQKENQGPPWPAR